MFDVGIDEKIAKRFFRQCIIKEKKTGRKFFPFFYLIDSESSSE